jgi:hypothetical protein
VVATRPQREVVLYLTWENAMVLKVDLEGGYSPNCSLNGHLQIAVELPIYDG